MSNQAAEGLRKTRLPVDRQSRASLARLCRLWRTRQGRGRIYISAAITSSSVMTLSLWRCSSLRCPRMAEPQRKSLSQASRIRFACEFW